MHSILRPLVFVFLVGWTTSWAGQYEQQCRNEGQSSDGVCNGAMGVLNRNDATRSGAAASRSGNAINPNAGTLGTTIDAQRADIQSALAQCESAKQQCQQKCKQALQQAQQAAQSQPPKPGAEDVATIPGTQKSSCESPIDQKIARLQQASSNLANNKQDSDKTKEASNSGGGAPSPPQSGEKGGKDGGKSDSSRQAEETKTLDCTDSTGHRFSDCDSHYTKICKKDPSSATCKKFSFRYCNLSTGDSTDEDVATTGLFNTASKPKTNLVIDKKGEGVGTEYCKHINAYNFCQIDGREKCPSCRSLKASQSAECLSAPELCSAENSAQAKEAARESCPTDPMFIDTTFAKTETGSPATSYDLDSGNDRVATQSEANSTGGGTYGSTQSSVLGGAAREGAASTTAISYATASVTGRSSPSGAYGSGSGGTGGSSGGSSTSQVNSAARTPLSSHERGPAGGTDPTLMPASAVSGMMDGSISNQNGPSVFSIATSTYRSLCRRGELKCR